MAMARVNKDRVQDVCSNDGDGTEERGPPAEVPAVVCDATLVCGVCNRDFIAAAVLRLLQLRNLVIDPRSADLAPAGNRGELNLRRTCAIAKYSIATDIRFIPRLTRIATSVDMPPMKAMKRGPISLQIRSMRFIWALTLRWRSERYSACIS
jgi:hypothetical protein